MASRGIRFVSILPPLEVDPVWKDGIGVEVKVDGVVVITDSSVSTRQVRILVMTFVFFGKIATDSRSDTTGLAVSCSGEMHALPHRVSRGCTAAA